MGYQYNAMISPVIGIVQETNCSNFIYNFSKKAIFKKLIVNKSYRKKLKKLYFFYNIMVTTNYVNKIYKVPVIEIKFNKTVHVSHLNTVHKRKFKYTHYLGKPTKKGHQNEATNRIYSELHFKEYHQPSQLKRDFPQKNNIPCTKHHTIKKKKRGQL